jgi:hypothetical protein
MNLAHVVTLLTFIQDVTGLNLSQDTSYPDFFMVSSSPSMQMLGRYLKL